MHLVVKRTFSMGHIGRNATLKGSNSPNSLKKCVQRVFGRVIGNISQQRTAGVVLTCN